MCIESLATVPLDGNVAIDSQAHLYVSLVQAFQQYEITHADPTESQSEKFGIVLSY